MILHNHCHEEKIKEYAANKYRQKDIVKSYETV